MNVHWEKPCGLTCSSNPPARAKQEVVQPVSDCAWLGSGILTKSGSACRFKHNLCLRANLLCVDRKVGAPHWQHFLRGGGVCGVYFSSALAVWSGETDCSHTTECVDKLPNTNTAVLSQKQARTKFPCLSFPFLILTNLHTAPSFRSFHYPFHSSHLDQLLLRFVCFYTQSKSWQKN